MICGYAFLALIGKSDPIFPPDKGVEDIIKRGWRGEGSGHERIFFEHEM